MNRNQVIFSIEDNHHEQDTQTSTAVDAKDVKWSFKISKAKYFIIIGFIVIILVLVAAIILVCISIAVPCLLVRCAGNATCHNYPFNPKCKCNFGFNGDGKEYCDECGVTYFNENSNTRIVGGQEAVKHSWPMSVLIAFDYKTLVDLDGESVLVSFSSFCGGTLIDVKTVITAAHCVIKTFDYNYNDKIYKISVTKNIFHPTLETIFTVYAGGHSTILEDVDISPAEAIPVDSIIIHELYDTDYNLNDIALMKLAWPVKLNENIQITCLPYPKLQTFHSDGNEVVVIGWGVTEENGDVSRTLQNVRIYLYEPDQCLNSTYEIKTNWDSQLCAGDLNGGRDSCQGDSGGSLFYQDTINGKKKYITIGIVSYGEGCGRVGLPGVYTRVSYFLDWIDKNAFS